MRFLKPKKIKLAMTQEGFDAQVDAFLLSHGFPVDAEYRKIFGAFIQHSPEDADSFDPELMSRRIRKAKLNEFAFYVMFPDKRTKPAAEEKTADGQELPAV